ncbi:MAG: 6-bladed beta-propeller [Betaproteobacteria bacterium]|nr:MAG: 6-bladed beta-propeller [Betaproteobacteria bacterium]
MSGATMRRFCLSFLGALLAGLLAGCATPTPNAASTPAVERVWPGPPERPRIRLLQIITAPEDVGIRPNLFDRFLEFLKGDAPTRVVRPQGLEADAAGRLYVIDMHYRFVHVFDGGGTRYYRFPAQPIDGFEQPIDLALGAGGRVYVSDSAAGRVHVFAEYGARYVTSFGGPPLKRPTGLAYRAATNELLVVDTLASQLLVYDADSFAFKRAVGKETEGADGFHSPTHIAIARDGTVYVTDGLNFRIQVLSADLRFLRTFGAAGDNPGHFSRPKGVAVDSDGNVYVVDALFDNVQIFDRDGRLLLAFGSPGAAAGELWLPGAIFIDARDRIYVADTYNQRIQVFQYLRAGNPP